VLKARADGYAIVDQELEEGLIAVAVPIHDRHGRVVAAVNLSTNVARWNAESVRRELLPALQRHAALIERDLANVV
jgi:IclR family pca regulon transcriptional regulator